MLADGAEVDTTVSSVVDVGIQMLLAPDVIVWT